MSVSNPLGWLALGCAAIAAALLVWFLIRRPKLVWSTRILLLLGLGAFPIATTTTGSVVNLEGSKDRGFCSSCHVMEPFTDDAADPSSLSLASRHSRNEAFGAESCYACHASYGMFGMVKTKMTGLRHVYEYYTHYRDTPVDEAIDRIALYEPFSNSTCMHCHSSRAAMWTDVPDHAGLLDEVRAGTVSCASEGCHGPAHGPVYQAVHARAAP